MAKIHNCKGPACSDYTITTKQPYLIRFVDSYFKNYKHKTLEWVETTAGSGENKVKMKDGTIQKCLGSPIIAAQRIETLRPDIDFHMTLVEGDLNHYKELKKNLECSFNSEGLYSLLCAENKTLGSIVDMLSEHGHGLIYYDTEGCSEFIGILDTVQQYKNFDVLCHLSAQSYKRVVGRVSHHIDPNYMMPTTEFIKTLGKKYNFISNPSVKIGWYFLFCTDDPDLIKDVGQANWLLPIDSKEGKQRLERATLTAAIQTELKENLVKDRIKMLEAKLEAAGIAV